MHKWCLVSLHSSIPVIWRSISLSLPGLLGSVLQRYISSSIFIKPVMRKLLLSRMVTWLTVDMCTALEWLYVANTSQPFIQRVTDGVVLTGRSRHGRMTFSPKSLIIVSPSPVVRKKLAHYSTIQQVPFTHHMMQKPFPSLQSARIQAVQSYTPVNPLLSIYTRGITSNFCTHVILAHVTNITHLFKFKSYEANICHDIYRFHVIKTALIISTTLKCRVQGVATKSLAMF